MAQALCDWWTDFQDVSDDARAEMLLPEPANQPKRKRRKRGPKPAAASTPEA
ncbi:MAG: hypothetical protein Q8M12_00005 [bacterium]|nr:hypothetical protein [bacterium]